jgi:hypothetical protein
VDVLALDRDVYDPHAFVRRRDIRRVPEYSFALRRLPISGWRSVMCLIGRRLNPVVNAIWADVFDRPAWLDRRALGKW